MVVIFFCAIVAMVLAFGGCANKPVPTVEEIITEVPEKRARCVQPEDLPACPAGTVKLITWRGAGHCVWQWTCASRGLGNIL